MSTTNNEGTHQLLESVLFELKSMRELLERILIVLEAED